MSDNRLAAALVAATLVALPARAEDPVRLEGPVSPTSEQVLLRVDPDALDYTGEVTIGLRVEAATTSFRLHAEDMQITSARLSGPDGDIDVEHAPGDWASLRITAAKPLAPGEYTLRLGFANEYGTKAVGLYRMEQDGHGYVFTQFEAIDAREAFPCWDEPGHKIPWRVTLEVPAGQKAFSNTPIEKETPAATDGWRRIEFGKTPPLPSYLVAVGVGPLEMVPIPGLKVPGRIITVAGQSGLAGLAAETAPPLLEALERWFGEPYPYQKLDLIAIPEYWPGAMEHPGAITYASNILLVDPAAASPGQKSLLVKVSAHEMAHQWFGDLVTMKWWDDLWLNETFADWMGDRIADEVYPEFERDIQVVQDGQDVMIGDARPSAQAIRQPVVHADLMDNVGVQYNKGKAVLDMFEAWMGPETFRTGVRAYLDAHRWGNAEAADLWSALDAAAKRDVSTSLATFIEQPGVPLVEVAVAGPGRLKLSQRRFASYGVDLPAQTWRIPVGLKWKDASGVHEKRVLLTDATTTLSLGDGASPSWVLPDAGQRGYYRWSVPPEMLQALADAAAGSLSDRERVGFVGNLSALLGAGLVDGGTYLAALGPFAADPQPMVVSGTLGALNRVRTAFVTSELEEPFAAYLRRTLSPVVERIGLDPRPDEDAAVTLVRPQLLDLLGYDGHDAHILAHASGLAKRYLVDPESVDASIAGVSLRLAARTGDRALFDAYRKAAETAQVPAVRTRYLTALGAFEEPELREAALAYTLAGQLRPNELFNIPGEMAGGAHHNDEVFAWVLDNYEALAGRLPPEYAPFLAFFGGGCSLERLERTREFFGAPERKGPATENQLARVSDQVQDCASLRAREGARAAAFLRAAAAP